MGYDSENGYTPRTQEESLQLFVDGVNGELGTAYTTDNIVGTNLYKIFYVQWQINLDNDARLAEIYQKLADYIDYENNQILEPRTSDEGIIDEFEKLGYVASVRPNTEAQAGKFACCVVVDATDPDYATKKQEILDTLKLQSAGGLWYDGGETGTSTLSNGQVMPYAFYLPTIKTIDVRLNILKSKNTLVKVDTPTLVEDKFKDNFDSIYRLGIDFEPEKYYQIDRDAPYASKIDTTYRVDGGEYVSDVYESVFNTILVLGNVEVTIDD